MNECMVIGWYFLTLRV